MTATPQPESAYAWCAPDGVAAADDHRRRRHVLRSTVVLPRVQAEFGVDRADASLPYTLTMIGFGLGGILMGRLADRFGVMVPLMVGALGLGAGFIAAGMAGSLWLFSAGAGPADRAARHLGHLRAAGGRHLAVVHAPARHRRGASA